MSDIFSFSRFIALLRKNLFERPVQLAGLMLLTLALVLISYSIVKAVSGYEDAQLISYMIGFLGGGCFLSSFLLGYFNSPALGSSFLTLPASTFEKWLSAVIICGFLFPAIFIGFFHLVDMIFVNAYHSSLNPKDPFFQNKYDSVRTFSFDSVIAEDSYRMYVIFVGSMLLGSLYFNRGAFIKVGLLVCGLYIGGVLLNEAIAHVYFDRVDRALPYLCVFIPVGTEMGKVMLPINASANVDISMRFVIPAILWITTFIRLREKEF